MYFRGKFGLFTNEMFGYPCAWLSWLGLFTAVRIVSSLKRKSFPFLVHFEGAKHRLKLLSWSGSNRRKEVETWVQLKTVKHNAHNVTRPLWSLHIDCRSWSCWILWDSCMLFRNQCMQDCSDKFFEGKLWKPKLDASIVEKSFIQRFRLEKPVPDVSIRWEAISRFLHICTLVHADRFLSMESHLYFAASSWLSFSCTYTQRIGLLLSVQRTWRIFLHNRRYILRRSCDTVFW